MGFAAPKSGKPVVGKGRLQVADIVVPQCQIGSEVQCTRQVFHAAEVACPPFQRVPRVVFNRFSEELDAFQQFMGIETFHGKGLAVRHLECCSMHKMTIT